MKAEILVGDVLSRLKDLPDGSVQAVVTSPPYWRLRDYNTEPQAWPSVEFRLLEWMPAITVPARCAMKSMVFRGVHNALKDDGVAFVNMSDSYANDSKWGGSTGGKHVSALHGEPVGRGKRQTGLKAKDLCGLPWMLAFALRADGWYLRQDIIWSKPNPMPESVTDRCTKAHEYLFLLSKSARYYFDQDAILEPVSVGTHARLSQDVEAQISSERANGGQKTNGNMKAVARSYKGSVPGRHNGPGQDRISESVREGRKLAEAGSGIKSNDSFSNAVCCLVDKRNKRSVWDIATQSFSEAHFATSPEALVEPCILAGSREDDTILDTFCGSGTTGVVALRYRRNFIGVELNPEYAEMAERRVNGEAPLFNDVAVNRGTDQPSAPAAAPSLFELTPVWGYR